MPYVVEQLALHLVDRKRFESARCSKATQPVANLPKEAKDFLNNHVEKICTCEEGVSTRPAHFRATSPVRDWYQQLLDHTGDFLSISQDLARRLFDVSPNTASPGLLMVVWFRSKGKNRRFLGMFKLDPSDEHLIKLDSSAKDQFAIGVEEIMEALPDADSNRVLKCAVVGHPTKDDYDLKFRDTQSTHDPAEYFQDFLGCHIRPSQKNQLRGVFDSIYSYALDHDMVPQWRERASVFASQLAQQKEPVTFNKVIDTAEDAQLFRDLERGDLEAIIGAEIPPDKVYLSGDTVALSKMTYHLAGDIIIRGPIDSMLALVGVKKVPQGYQFKITQPGEYTVTYD